MSGAGRRQQWQPLLPVHQPWSGRRRSVLRATTIDNIAPPAQEEQEPEQPAAVEDKKRGVPYDQLTVGVVKESTPGERRCAPSFFLFVQGHRREGEARGVGDVCLFLWFSTLSGRITLCVSRTMCIMNATNAAVVSLHVSAREQNRAGRQGHNNPF